MRTKAVTGVPRFDHFNFSFFHMSRRGASVSSSGFPVSKLSRVSRRICCTLMSRPSRRSSLTVAANLLSRFLVKDLPGLSASMRTSMMALYWT